MSGKSAHRLLTAAVIALATAAVIIGWRFQLYYPAAIAVVVLALLPVLLRFEHRRPRAGELVTLAVICALGIAGRAAFALLPSCKPVAAIVILAGVCLGAESGFLCGAITMFVSNFLFGQGPWTPFQMLALGLVGLLAGVLFFHRPKRLWPLCVYGGLSVPIIYGGLINGSSLLLMKLPLTLPTALAVYGAALPMDAVFAISTVLFLLPLYPVMTRSLARLHRKFGLFTHAPSSPDR